MSTSMPSTLPGAVSEREGPVVFGQADAKNSSSNDRVEARGRLGVGATHQGGQKQAGEDAGSKPDGTLEECKGHGSLGPAAQGDRGCGIGPPISIGARV